MGSGKLICEKLKKEETTKRAISPQERKKLDMSGLFGLVRITLKISLKIAKILPEKN